jgi:hypothetical protein
MEQSTVTLVVAGLGIGGTLSSGIVAQWMSRSSQHQEWQRDNKSQECRELLNALGTAYWALLEWNKAIIPLPFPISGHTSVGDADVNDQLAVSIRDLQKTFGNRLLIASEVQRAEIMRRWLDAVAEYISSRKEEKLTAVYEDLCKRIVYIALTRQHR